ncbi:MAG: CpaD family pilus assembly protein [Hyphomicrobiales bacterium]|nr:CpaD family pilus assembly protein [Hyphomicrobiales bacterium]
MNETSSMPRPSHRSAQRLALLVACLAAGALSGCVDYASNDPALIVDYHTVHPIVLADAPTTLDIFPVGEGLDERTRADIRAFVQRYRELGTGRIAILTPAGRYGRSERVVDEIRRAIAATGLRGYVGVGSYPVADALQVAPVRLAFQGLKAAVPTACGQWPTDLASGSSIEGWKNQGYENFGCATQSMLAAQVADPRDLEQARALGSPDVAMRMRAIGDVRNGQDPGTQWQNQLTPIGVVGSGG